MSQNLDIGPSFHFMKCRNKYFDLNQNFETDFPPKGTYKHSQKKSRQKHEALLRYPCSKNKRWKISYNIVVFIIQVRMLYIIRGQTEKNMSFHMIYKLLLWWSCFRRQSQ